MISKILNNDLTKKIAFFVGCLSIIVGGLWYVLITDLYLLNSSGWLFLGIICALGGGVCTILSDLFKNKKTAFYILRGTSFVLIILFVVVLFAYRGHVSKIITDIIKAKKYTKRQINKYFNLAYLPAFILSIFSFVASGISLAQNIIYGIDD